MGAVQELDRASTLRRVDLVQTELVVENIDGPIRLAARLPAEVGGTVDEHACAVERVAHATVTIEVALGHEANTTR